MGLTTSPMYVELSKRIYSKAAHVDQAKLPLVNLAVRPKPLR
jgi:hypothetical protein